MNLLEHDTYSNQNSTGTRGRYVPGPLIERGSASLDDTHGEEEDDQQALLPSQRSLQNGGSVATTTTPPPAPLVATQPMDIPSKHNGKVAI